MEQYNKVVTAAMNWAVEAKVATALDTLGTGTVNWDGAGAVTPDGTVLRSALLEGSVAVEDATGTPASVAVASTDMFIRLGSTPNVFPGTYGTSNVTGTVSAASLDLNVSGLQVVRAPALLERDSDPDERDRGGDVRTRRPHRAGAERPQARDRRGDVHVHSPCRVHPRRGRVAGSRRLRDPRFEGEGLIPVAV